MRLPRVIAPIALAALLAAAQPAGAAKPKAVTCKAGQVKVKAGKKKARCRSVRAVLPKPRAIDPRVAFVQSALDLPVPKGKKARSAKRRTRSLRRGFGRAGKRAYTKMLRALPKALAKVDARAPGRAPAGLARIASARAAQANPCGENADALGSSTTSDGGVITTTTLTRGGLGTTIVFNVGDLALVIEYSTTVGCRNLDVPACPTASGAADAQRDTLDRLRVDVRRDGRLVSSQRSSARRQTKTHGQTAGDAKLDTVDVDDAVTINTTANGVSIAGRLTRHMRINMRSEQVEPSRSTATFVGADALQRSDNGNFASLAAGIIRTYRSAESEPDRLGIGGGWAVSTGSTPGPTASTAASTPSAGP
jgi:hypothetical protein